MLEVWNINPPPGNEEKVLSRQQVVVVKDGTVKLEEERLRGGNSAQAD